MNTLFVAGAVAIALGVTHLVAYKHGVSATEDRIRAEQADQRELARNVIADARREIGAEVVAKIEKLRPVYRNITQETVREIIEKPVYRDPNCAVPASGVVQLNAARRGEHRGTGSDPDAAASKGAAAAGGSAPAGRPSPR